MNIRPATRDQVMRVVDELKKKNPQTLKLLGYPATFKESRGSDE